MKLIPAPIWQPTTASSSPSVHVPRSEIENEPTTFLSSFWRSFVVGNPPLKRSPVLEKRKDKTITVTQTDKITETVLSTIFINQTTTIRMATTIWSTRLITSFQPTTITHNMTMTTPFTVSLSSTPSATKTSAKKAEIANETSLPSPSAPPVTSKQHLPTVAVVGIVFGALALLGLIIGGFWLVRRFYKMYRRERVLRKQLQTEGNEMPAMKTGEGGGE